MRLLFSLLLLGCAWSTSAQTDREFTWDDVNAMDEYVHRDDGWYSWRILDTIRYDNFSSTLYVVNMTSQKWMDESFTSRSLWWHIMGVAVPDEARYPDAGVMAITGGSNRDDYDVPGQYDLYNLLAARIASDCGCVAGYMRQVPNQSMRFTNDPLQKSKSEDRIIAWTWKSYIDRTITNPEVILRMPMTKAGKRGLDTMTQVAKYKTNGEFDPQRFAITGGSKRGWTTWSVAATDQRVVCMFPLVFSLLDMNESAMNHYRALGGGWSWALKDYWNDGILMNVFNPRMQDVLDYEDMIRYRPRFTIPKLMVAAVGDEFFSLTDSHPWWDRMVDPKFMLMIPNAEHTLAPHYLKIYRTLLGMWLSVLQDRPLPHVTWTRGETGNSPNRRGQIDMHFDTVPLKVTGYYGTTADKTESRRDFRMVIAENRPCGYALPNGNCTTEPHLYLWRDDTEENVHMITPTHYRMIHTEPESINEQLWTGMFMEAQFEGADGFIMSFTSEVQMIPDMFPAEPCTQDPDCHTFMV